MDLSFDLAINAMQVCLTLILPEALHTPIRSRKKGKASMP